MKLVSLVEFTHLREPDLLPLRFVKRDNLLNYRLGCTKHFLLLPPHGGGVRTEHTIIYLVDPDSNLSLSSIWEILFAISFYLEMELEREKDRCI